MLRNSSQFIRTTPAMLFAAWLGMAGLQACNVCPAPGIDGLTPPHPRALEIAIATRTAHEKGELTSTNEFAKSSGAELARLWMLKHQPFTNGITHLMLVDADSEGEIAIDAKGNIITALVESDGNRHVITTRGVLHALTTGKLTLARARAAHLLVIEEVR